jgi:hypothetical protein
MRATDKELVAILLKGRNLMSTEANIFTPEQIASTSMGNIEALCLASIVFAKENGFSPEDYWSSIGRLYAPGWEGMAHEPLVEVVKRIAINMVSVGAKLVSLAGEDKKAEAVFSEWPSTDLLSFFGVSQAEADTTWGVFEPIAEDLGMEYQWHRDGDQVLVTLK